MKIDFIADTNFLIYIHEGNKITEPFLAYDFGISFISEVELLGFKGITKHEEIKLKQLINDCFTIEWSTKLKEQTIQLRKKYVIKLPDAIIASTSLIYNIPLITADKGFSKIEELDLILIEI
jgi:predicted nucleic acid-binding protein